jgi:hypothetical protein
MKITVEDVLIKTASIEVKILTLTRKQVTQAVFRQLDKVHFVNLETFEFEGKLWGRINYHDSCREGLEHMHIVWQREDHLLHGIVYKNFNDQCDFIDIKMVRNWQDKQMMSPEQLIRYNKEIHEKIMKWEVLYNLIEDTVDHLFIAV